MENVEGQIAKLFNMYHNNDLADDEVAFHACQTVVACHNVAVDLIARRKFPEAFALMEETERILQEARSELRKVLTGVELAPTIAALRSRSAVILQRFEKARTHDNIHAAPSQQVHRLYFRRFYNAEGQYEEPVASHHAPIRPKEKSDLDDAGSPDTQASARREELVAEDVLAVEEPQIMRVVTDGERCHRSEKDDENECRHTHPVNWRERVEDHILRAVSAQKQSAAARERLERREDALRRERDARHTEAEASASARKEAALQKLNEPRRIVRTSPPPVPPRRRQPEPRTMAKRIVEANVEMVATKVDNASEQPAVVQQRSETTAEAPSTVVPPKKPARQVVAQPRSFGRQVYSKFLTELHDAEQKRQTAADQRDAQVAALEQQLERLRHQSQAVHPAVHDILHAQAVQRIADEHRDLEGTARVESKISSSMDFTRDNSGVHGQADRSSSSFFGAIFLETLMDLTDTEVLKRHPNWMLLGIASLETNIDLVLAVRKMQRWARQCQARAERKSRQEKVNKYLNEDVRQQDASTVIARPLMQFVSRKRVALLKNRMQHLNDERVDLERKGAFEPTAPASPLSSSFSMGGTQTTPWRQRHGSASWTSRRGSGPGSIDLAKMQHHRALEFHAAFGTSDIRRPKLLKIQRVVAARRIQRIYKEYVKHDIMMLQIEAMSYMEHLAGKAPYPQVLPVSTAFSSFPIEPQYFAPLVHVKLSELQAQQHRRAQEQERARLQAEERRRKRAQQLQLAEQSRERAVLLIQRLCRGYRRRVWVMASALARTAQFASFSGKAADVTRLPSEYAAMRASHLMEFGKNIIPSATQREVLGIVAQRNPHLIPQLRRFHQAKREKAAKIITAFLLSRQSCLTRLQRMLDREAMKIQRCWRRSITTQRIVLSGRTVIRGLLLGGPQQDPVPKRL